MGGVWSVMEAKNTHTDYEELLQHSGWIRGLAFATLRDYALAEDVSQEVLMKAVAGKRRTGKVLQAWLAAVTRNVSRNELRTLIRRRDREAKVVPMDSAHSEAERKELLLSHQVLTTAVEALAPSSQEIIVLRFYSGHRFPEIARQLGITVGNARVRLHRALNELREHLQKEQGDWRASCLLAAPVGIGKTGNGGDGGSTWRWGSGAFKLTLLAASLAILGGAAIWWPTANSSSDGIQNLSAEAALEDKSLMGATPMLNSESTTRALIVEKEDDRESSTPTLEPCTGRVFHNGIPVKDAEVILWQDGVRQFTATDENGDYAFALASTSRVGLSVRWNGFTNATLWSKQRRQPLRIHLWERPAEESTIEVVDAVTQQPIADAQATVFINWRVGQSDVGLLNENALEFAFEGNTNEDGRLDVPPELAGLSKVIRVSAPGFRSNAAWESKISLYPGEDLPIQLVMADGSPAANLQVRQGKYVAALDETDGQGFLANIGEWALASRTEEAQSLPKSLIVYLPDGKIWEHQAVDFKDEDVEVFEDRIQLTIHTTPIQVRLDDCDLPEGSWVEVHCEANQIMAWSGPAAPPRGSWIPQSEHEPTWQALSGSDWTELKHGWLVPVSKVIARVMPGEYTTGYFPVTDGKAVISIKGTELNVTVHGWPIEEKMDLVLELDRGGKLPVLNGNVKTMVFQDSVQRARFMDQSTGMYLGVKVDVDQFGATAYGRGQSGRKFSFALKPGEVNHIDATALGCRYESVLVRIDGLPVMDGAIAMQPIALDGTIPILMNDDGTPQLKLWGYGQISLQPAMQVRAKEGGPILSSFNFFRNCEIPGRFHHDSTGQLIWDLELASVELDVPAIPGEVWNRFLRTEISSMSSSLNWPPEEGMVFGGKQLEVPEEGGILSFRVPAGRHIFLLGQNVSYGGVDGVVLEAGTVTTLQPDSN